MRAGRTVVITPSGIGYREMQPAQVCAVSLDVSLLAADASVNADALAAADPAAGGTQPSSELPMHLAIYAAAPAAAIVHTHSAEVVALSAGCDELPAIHYAITDLGGPVRVAPYERFGSGGLAQAAAAALAGRQAVILRNHGAVTTGASLSQAYERALLLEWLARVYRLARSYGEPDVLTHAELAEVSEHARQIGYGTRRSAGGPG